MDQDDIHGFDEATTTVAKFMPPALWTFFQNCKSEGFTEDQAFKLTTVWLKVTLGGYKIGD